MKTSLAIIISSTAILLPTAAVSAQPTPPADRQAATKAQAANGSENSAETSQKCAAPTKSAQARQEHDPSALPGKDTGWTPPKRKPKITAAPGCDTQPQ